MHTLPALDLQREQKRTSSAFIAHLPGCAPRDWEIQGMSKPAEAITSESHDLLPDEGVDGDKLFLRQLKEEEIRAKLEEFARELAQLQAERV